MNKNLRNNLILISILLLLVILKLSNSKSNRTSSKLIYEGDKNSITKIIISQKENSIELLNDEGRWNILGNDTLIVKQERIDKFFDNVLGCKKQTLLSTDKDQWPVLSVDDSSGTHVSIFNKNDDKLAHYIFGRSKIDFQRNNIRIGEDPNVYLTNKNVINDIFPRDTFWGEKPKNIISESDSLKLSN